MFSPTIGPVSALQFNAASCQHCRSPYGHFISCPAINRASAEAHSTVQSELSPEDVLRIVGLGIKW